MMKVWGLAIAITAFAFLPRQAEAFCLMNCPPSDSAAVSVLKDRLVGVEAQFISLKGTDSKDENFMGAELHTVYIDFAVKWANGSSQDTAQAVVAYEKRNSGWVLTCARWNSSPCR
jgi:hypothetical protein